MVFSLIAGSIASSLGAGATGQAIASGIGGLAGSALKNSMARKNANKAQLAKFSKLRKSAERAGFNPLTALNASGGAGFGATAAHTAPLASSSAIMGQVQDVQSILAGEGEIDRAHKQAQTSLMEAETAALTAGGFGQRVATRQNAGGAGPDMGRNATPVSDENSMGPRFGINTVRGPSPRKGQQVELEMPESVRRQHLGPLRQSLTMSDGTVYSVPVLPEPEEILMGFGAEIMHNWRDEIKGTGDVLEFIGRGFFGSSHRTPYEVKDAAKGRKSPFSNRPTSRPFSPFHGFQN